MTPIEAGAEVAKAKRLIDEYVSTDGDSEAKWNAHCKKYVPILLDEDADTAWKHVQEELTTRKALFEDYAAFHQAVSLPPPLPSHLPISSMEALPPPFDTTGVAEAVKKAIRQKTPSSPSIGRQIKKNHTRAIYFKDKPAAATIMVEQTATSMSNNAAQKDINVIDLKPLQGIPREVVAETMQRFYLGDDTMQRRGKSTAQASLVMLEDEISGGADEERLRTIVHWMAGDVSRMGAAKLAAHLRTMEMEPAAITDEAVARVRTLLEEAKAALAANGMLVILP